MPRRRQGWSGRFGNSLEFEFAMREFLGDEARHTADWATSPKLIKTLSRRVIKKIRERIDNIITMDERLRLRLHHDIGALSHEVEKIDRENNDWIIISRLLLITARLLGYNAMNGKVSREVIYHQTKEQELAESKIWKREYIRENYENERNEDWQIYFQRAQLILTLYDSGNDTSEIARIMNTTEYAVNHIANDDVLREIIEKKLTGLRDAEIAREMQVSCDVIEERIERAVKLAKRGNKKKASASLI